MDTHPQHIGTDAREYTYFPIDNIVLDAYDLTAVELALYVAIVRFANRKTGAAFPGFPKLAQASGMSEKSVQRHIVTLENKGLIRIERTDGKSNHYTVLNPHRDGQAASIPGLSDQGSPDRTGEIVLAPDRESRVEPDTPVRESVVAPPSSSDPSQRVRAPWTESPDTLVGESRPRSESPSNNNVVVVDSESDSDIPDQQQQQTPAAMPAREPAPAERELLKQARIAEFIWRGWMQHDAVTVVAAILHATQEDEIRNPVGLMRAMLEQGTAVPNPKYVQAARDRLGLEDEDKAAYSKALEEAGWDPRFVDRDENGRWVATRRVERTDPPVLETTESSVESPEPAADSASLDDARPVDESSTPDDGTAMDWRAAWATVMERMRAHLDPPAFDVIRNSTATGCVGGTLTLRTAVPSDVWPDLQHVIEQMLRDVAGQRVRVKFEAAPAAATVGGGA